MNISFISFWPNSNSKRLFVPAVAVSLIIGTFAVFIRSSSGWSILDPLVVALLLGMGVRSFLKLPEGFGSAVIRSARLLLPVGIPFYAYKNLNFVRGFSDSDFQSIMIIACVLLTYFLVIILLGRILGGDKRVCYLTAVGSAICGASAIAITAGAIKSRSNDVSVSIAAVCFCGLAGTFLLLPFLATVLCLNAESYGLFAGSVLQITGFVKAAVSNVPFLEGRMDSDALINYSMAVKAFRYFALIIAVPVLASLARGRFCLPLELWLFFAAGAIGTFVYAFNSELYEASLTTVVKPSYSYIWAAAMAGVGLNADLRNFISADGIRTLILAALAMVAASAVFLAGVVLLGMI